MLNLVVKTGRPWFIAPRLFKRTFAHGSGLVALGNGKSVDVGSHGVAEEPAMRPLHLKLPACCRAWICCLNFQWVPPFKELRMLPSSKPQYFIHL